MTGEITCIKRRDESLRFLGNWHESIPRILFMDPFMHSQDRNVYCVIRALISEEGVAPHREMRFPDYSEIMKYGNIRSRATVAKSITAARIIGWIVQNNPSEGLVRDETSGRFKPKQWLFLDEPMPHSEICQYDHGFVAFVKQAADRRDEHISDLARRVLAALIDDHGSEQDETLYERRLGSYEAVKADSNPNPETRFFGISQKPADENPNRPGFQEEEKPPCTEYEHGGKSPCTEYEHGKKSPSTVYEHGNLHHISAISPSAEYEHGENHRVQNMNSAPCSSSSRKTTTTKPNVQKKRAALFKRIGFNPNFCSIFTTRFDRLPDEYQALIILEMNARMDRKLNRNDVAYLGHLLKTTLSALQQDDPGLLIFTPEYSSPDPGESQSPATDPTATMKQELQHAHADYRHWQQMQQSATEAQLKQVNVMVEMAKTKIEMLKRQQDEMQKQSGSGP